MLSLVALKADWNSHIYVLSYLLHADPKFRIREGGMAIRYQISSTAQLMARHPRRPQPKIMLIAKCMAAQTAAILFAFQGCAVSIPPIIKGSLLMMQIGATEGWRSYSPSISRTVPWLASIDPAGDLPSPLAMALALLVADCMFCLSIARQDQRKEYVLLPASLSRICNWHWAKYHVHLQKPKQQKHVWGHLNWTSS